MGAVMKRATAGGPPPSIISLPGDDEPPRLGTGWRVDAEKVDARGERLSGRVTSFHTDALPPCFRGSIHQRSHQPPNILVWFKRATRTKTRCRLPARYQAPCS